MVQLTAERPTSRTSYLTGPLKQEQQDIQSLVLSCNKDGMESMRKGELKAAFEQLKYAEAIMIANNTEASNDSLLAVTYNNLGCFFKKTGKMHAALSYLRRALKSEVALETDDVTVAGTHLNICSVLSKLGKHDKANQHALMALELISAKLNQHPDTVTHDDYMVLAMAYHNVAVEREYLKDWDHAAMAYKQGYQVAKRILGEDHPFAETLNANCEKACTTASKIIKEKSMACRNDNSALEEFRAKVGVGIGIQDPRDTLPEVEPTAQDSKDQVGEVLDKTLEAKLDEVKAPVALPQIMVGGSSGGITDMAAFAVDQEEKEWNNFATQTMASVSRASSVGSVRVSARMGASMRMGAGATDHPEDESALMYISPIMGMQPPKAISAKDTLTDLPPLKMNQLLPVVKELKKKGPGTDQLLEDSPELLMEIIDLERDSHRRRCPVRSAPNDNRPNRVIKGSTRTSLVLRRTGMFNVTLHRDEVIAKHSDPKGSKSWYSAHVQSQAAMKIQEAWRKWHEYCAQHADWMSTTRICATLIQARWRAYHVKRVKLDRAAVCIQRHMRRFLVINVLRRHTAAVCIQRHVAGMDTRRKLRILSQAAIHIQRLVRGGLMRKRMRQVIERLTQVARVIQKYIRALMARRRIEAQRQRQRDGLMLVRAAVKMQSIFRGFKGRKRFEEKLREKEHENYLFMAATKIQSLHRKNLAEKRVGGIREQRIGEMNRAATFVRKLWLCFSTRKRYLELKRDFESHIEAILTIQKYARGFLVRLRLWREAVQAQEELWAAVEIQRCWRGRLGRAHWDYVYEVLWVREVAAARIQCHVRGWMARVRVNRTKRQLARKEFEGARKRYKSAQKIQALLRGVHVRKFTSPWRYSVISAIIFIQKIWRGHSLRCNLWEQTIQQKATAIQALVRGTLVRIRLERLLKAVLRLQRGYRNFKARPAAKIRQLLRRWQKRKLMAVVIQTAIRKFLQKKEIQAIKGAEASTKPQN